MNSIIIIQNILACYSLFLVGFGTVTNLLSFRVCLRKKLIKVPTFVFLSFMLISDTIALYFWNFDNFLLNFFGFIIEGFSSDSCKLVFTSQIIVIQFSAWCLVSVLTFNLI